MSQEHARIEMDLASGSSKPYGSSRSIVRRIATHLPIQPCPRVHFQLFPYSEDAGVLISSGRPDGLVASLADVPWLDEEEEDVGRPRSGIPPGLVFRAQHHTQRKALTRQSSLPSLHQGAPDPQGPAATNDVAIQKISALETELAKLRAQIAQIVLAQEQNAQPAATTTGPPHPPPPPCGNLPPPPPPPPPPPLPPPPPPGLQRTFSAIDLIKERRGKKAEGQTVLDPRPVAEIPNMLDVLKDISKVKLRSVKSRPLEADTKVKSSDPVDAGALIAEALKRKFAHRYRHDSEPDDKEDFCLPVPEVKPQPKTPLFGQHMLRSTGTRKLL